MPVIDPTRRLRLWLGGRATTFSLEVLFASLCGSPRQIHPFWSCVGSSQDTELGCDYFFSNHAFFRRVRQPAASSNLSKEGVYIYLVMLLAQGRVRTRNLACSSDVPGSGDYFLTKT